MLFTCMIKQLGAFEREDSSPQIDLDERATAGWRRRKQGSRSVSGLAAQASAIRTTSSSR